MRRTIAAALVSLISCAGADEDASTQGSTTTATVSPTSAGASGLTAADPSTTLSTAASATAADGATESGGLDTGSTSTGGGPQGTLEIVWIDTEGGAATLLVTPQGPLVLVDAGFPGDRDADRINAVVRDELGRERIDLLVVTHYHLDHVGGVPDLVERLAVDEFWDHGDSVEARWGPDEMALWQDYLTVADGLRTVVSSGMSREIGGVELEVVSANGVVISEPLAGGGAANPACDGAEQMPVATDENPMSVGMVVRFGAFELLDLGDLTWSYEMSLACPVNLLGPIDLYQTSHHGQGNSGATPLVHGIAPTVIVMNNGATKGGASATFDRLFSTPTAPDLWQVHRAENNDDAHNAMDDRIANPDAGGDLGWSIRARIESDGSYTVINDRNDVQAQYAAN